MRDALRWLLAKGLGGTLLPPDTVPILERRLSILEEQHELLQRDYNSLDRDYAFLKARVDEFTGIKTNATRS